MNEPEILILLMTLAVLCVGLAQKSRIPYPIALILGGSLIGLVPGLSNVDFDPNLVLITVLPPILYHAAFTISFREFKANFNLIFSLALALVVITTLVIGVLFKWLFPELPWALAFIFGAIISPSDAIAATSVLRRFAINSRVLTILEGESLVNDASSLVLIRIALVALLTDSFSVVDASIEFVRVTVGGLAVGIVTGYVFNKISSRFFDPILAVVYSFTIPYAAYLLADTLGVSGVLSVVANGLVGARMLITHFSSLTRVIGGATWYVVAILINCYVFILIGAQIRNIVGQLESKQLILYSIYGLLFTLALIAIRMLWVYFQTSMSYLSKMRQERHFVYHRSQVFREATIIGWASMRGIVSLAAALSLPFHLPNGFPLIGRELVIFLTFIVIVLTLLIPGLSLTSLVHFFKIRQDFKENKFIKARRKLVLSAEEEIRHLYHQNHVSDEEYITLLTYFRIRYRFLNFNTLGAKAFSSLELARLKIYKAQRKRLLHMWEHHEVDDEMFSLLEREIDLAELQLAQAEFRNSVKAKGE